VLGIKRARWHVCSVERAFVRVCCFCVLGVKRARWHVCSVERLLLCVWCQESTLARVQCGERAFVRVWCFCVFGVKRARWHVCSVGREHLCVSGGANQQACGGRRWEMFILCRTQLWVHGLWKCMFCVERASLRVEVDPACTAREVHTNESLDMIM